MKTIIINHYLCIPLSQLRRHKYKNDHVLLTLQDTSIRLEFVDFDEAAAIFYMLQEFYNDDQPTLTIECKNEIE